MCIAQEAEPYVGLHERGSNPALSGVSMRFLGTIRISKSGDGRNLEVRRSGCAIYEHTAYGDERIEEKPRQGTIWVK